MFDTHIASIVEMHEVIGPTFVEPPGGANPTRGRPRRFGMLRPVPPSSLPSDPSRISRTLAALFLLESPAWARQVRGLGWWLALCPPLGWPMALGTRKLVVCALGDDDATQRTQGPAAPLPAQGGATWRSLWEGLGALGVIVGHFTPVLAAAWTLGATDPWSSARVGDFALFWASSFVLVPVTLGGVPALWTFWVPGFSLSLLHAAALAGAAALTVAVIPASFLQVGDRGRYADALKPWRSLRTLWAARSAYAQAWAISIRLTLAALSLGPLAPWGIAWSYFGIVFAFNEARAAAAPGPAPETWLRRLRADRALARGNPDRLWGPWVLEHRSARRAQVFRETEQGKLLVAQLLKLWGVWVPLPPRATSLAPAG